MCYNDYDGSFVRTARETEAVFVLRFWGSHCAGEIPGVAGSSSLANGDQVFSGSCGFEHHKIMPGVGGGGVKEWAKPFYKSKAWRDCREAYFI